LLIRSLFPDAVSVSKYITSNDQVTVSNELDRVWNQAIVASFQIPSRKFPGEPKVKYEKSQLAKWMSWPKLELETFRIKPRE
jgi:hypothetical protein